VEVAVLAPRRHVAEEAGERKVLPSLLDEHSEHGQSAACCAVHEVELHQEASAGDRVLAGRVEVELHEPVPRRAEHDRAGVAFCLGLDRVAVVDDPKLGGAIRDSEHGSRRPLSPAEVDR
jgi:hypothetical protein